MQNILLCSDYSENAQKAIDLCLRLFKHDSKNYFLLNTFSFPPEETTDTIHIIDHLKAKSKKALEKEYLRICQLAYSNYSLFKKQSVFGETENVIKRFIDKNKVDLVVIGNQGMGHAPEKLFGSTTCKIIDSIQVPLLLVPNSEQTPPPSYQLMLTEERKLYDKKWWYSMSELNHEWSIPVHLFVIKEAGLSNSPKASPSIPFNSSSISYIHYFDENAFDSLNESIHQTIQKELPSIFNVNISNPHLLKELFQHQNHLLYHQTPILLRQHV